MHIALNGKLITVMLPSICVVIQFLMCHVTWKQVQTLIGFWWIGWKVKFEKKNKKEKEKTMNPVNKRATNPPAAVDDACIPEISLSVPFGEIDKYLFIHSDEMASKLPIHTF